MYQKLAGMTGTAKTEENEFREIYNLDVIEVPTIKPMIRVDHNDIIYKNEKAEVRFIKGRLKFGNAKNSAPFPSMVVIFK